MKLQEFLAQKPLYYKKIDYDRMPQAFKLLKPHLHLPKIIHIVGTNGKGSTGRFLAGALKEAGFRVGHYTSPHILRFNERIWVNGADASDELLEVAHEKLQRLLPQKVSEALSYFEYTTFLAMLAFEECDFAVVEAGLGGEFDATAVFPNILTLVTTIDYDHQAFLGETIKAIATTKLNAIQKKGIVGYQTHFEVKEVAKRYPVQFIEEYDIDLTMLEKIVAFEGLAPFFAKNLALAQAACIELGVEFAAKSAVCYRLPGRMERRGNVILDVGHNPLSAQAIANALQEQVVLVYNSYEDKAYDQILQILQPKIEYVELIEIEDERIVDRNKLIEAIEHLGLEWRKFERIDPKRHYLVYGSFKVVEEFLKRESEVLRISAKK